MQPIQTFSTELKTYEIFQKVLPKDEIQRWFQEAQYVERLIIFANNENLQEEVNKFKNIKANACDELEKRGYKYETLKQELLDKIHSH